jgi:hypothetical protein
VPGRMASQTHVSQIWINVTWIHRYAIMCNAREKKRFFSSFFIIQWGECKKKSSSCVLWNEDSHKWLSVLWLKETIVMNQKSLIFRTKYESLFSLPRPSTVVMMKPNGNLHYECLSIDDVFRRTWSILQITISAS